MKPGTVVHLAGAALIVASLALWSATGREGFTRWPDQRLAQSDAAPIPGESELLADAGFSDSAHAQPRPDIQSRFALGLVPGGATPLHLLSVATAAALAVAASSLVIMSRLIRRNSARRSAAVHTSGVQS